MYLIPTVVSSKLVIRFTITSQFTTKEDIVRDWGIIHHTATAILAKKAVDQIINGSGEVLTAHSDMVDGVEARDEEQCALECQPRGNIGIQEARHITYTATRPQNAMLPSDTYGHQNGLDHRRTTRSLSCNGEMLTGPKDSDLLRLLSKDVITATRNVSCIKEVVLSKIPESAGILEKRVSRRLTKQYSVPVFSQCGIRCGVIRPCCSFKALQIFNKPWFACSRVSSALT